MRMWMRRGAAAAVLAGLVLSGCGGDDDDASTDTPASTEAAGTETTEAAGTETTEADPSGDPIDSGGTCPYLATEDLSAAFGSTFEVLAGAETGCAFTDEDGLGVQVGRIDIQIDPETYAEEATESCEEGTLVEVEAGDRAYACIAIGPNASYYEGDVLISLSVLTADDEQAVVDAFAEVLPSITVPA